VDFIERIFHISPDHGSGALEVTILVTVFAIPIVTVILRKLLKRRTVRVS
jgi:hypothetical protein